MTIGEKIIYYRNIKNITQKQLAESIGVSVGTVAEWESDEVQPGVDELIKISDELSVSVDFLVKDTITEKSSEDKTDNIQLPEKKNVRKKNLILKILLFVVGVALVGLIVVLCVNLFNNDKLPFSEDTDAMAQAAESVVKIYCYDFDGNESGTGSGFVAFDDKTIVTNYHVMENAYTCKVSTEQDKTYNVREFIYYSKENDIAILKLSESTGLSPLTFGNSEEMKKGETVVAIGSPLGLKNTISQGVLSGRVMEDSMDVLQFTAAISGGSSGGALFDDVGNVIGITYASYVDGQSLNLAIPIEFTDELYTNPKPENLTQNKHISSIYIEAHPYVPYLYEFTDAIEVSVDDLSKDLNKYINQSVKLKAYVSSIKYRNHGEDDFISIHFSEKKNISGDYEYDSWLWDAREQQKSFITYMTCVVDTDKSGDNIAKSEYKYIDRDIDVGDCVTVFANVVNFLDMDIVNPCVIYRCN